MIAVYLVQLQPGSPAGFHTFELNLRVNLHDTVHCRVGGIMCRRASANAPEFFLHHAFIDKIWANWQEYSNEHMSVHFQNIRSTMTETGYSPADYIDSVDLPNPGRFGRRTGQRTCVLYQDPTPSVFREVLQRLDGMTRRQILAIPRHSFAPLNNRQMRFFNVNRRERRQARRNLRRELEPRNELIGNAGLTGINGDLGSILIPFHSTKEKNDQYSERRKIRCVRDGWLKIRNKDALSSFLRRLFV